MANTKKLAFAMHEKPKEITAKRYGSNVSKKHKNGGTFDLLLIK